LASRAKVTGRRPSKCAGRILADASDPTLVQQTRAQAFKAWKQASETGSADRKLLHRPVDDSHNQYYGT
jgi:hypothetical protein